MKNSKLSPRSIKYSLAVVRQVFNFARRNGVFLGENPVLRVTLPQEDNRRMRFLTSEEATILLHTLYEKNHQLFEIALLSLHCGLRSKEIASLTFGDIDVDRKQIFVKDSKNKLNRVAYMTEDVKEMLCEKDEGEPDELVFRDHHGQKLKDYFISTQFSRILGTLGFNDGITDRRQKVVFHTLRHTFCSWLVQNGESLYTVKELAGHKTLSMTARYSHLSNDTMVKAVEKFQRSFGKGGSLKEA